VEAAHQQRTVLQETHLLSQFGRLFKIGLRCLRFTLVPGLDGAFYNRGQLARKALLRGLEQCTGKGARVGELVLSKCHADQWLERRPLKGTA